MSNDPYIDTTSHIALHLSIVLSVKFSSSSSMKSVGRGYSCVSRIRVVFFFFFAISFSLTFTSNMSAEHVESINIDFHLSAGGIEYDVSIYGCHSSVYDRLCNQLYNKSNAHEMTSKRTGKIRRQRKVNCEVKTLSKRIQTIKNVQGRMTERTETKLKWNRPEHWTKHFTFRWKSMHSSMVTSHRMQ